MASEGEPRELAIIEPADNRRRHLATGKYARMTVGVANRRRKLVDPCRQLGDPDVVIVADVRRGADRGDAVGFCLLGHRHGVGEIPGAVVEPGRTWQWRSTAA